MHPPYTAEKLAADKMARAGKSVDIIMLTLRKDFGLGVYEAHIIAVQAVGFTERGDNETI